ncbi:Uncharacterized conserved protein [Nitrosomonas cryotolerans]|uniref:Uncharacterized conserved protein n=1 Tax=Nitrosomonas cryotolerans ATCC 49181 TaxID=1131553 RepID=A0A1N6F6T6_9PROT|nr:DUF411 domain-containing protein [Nitrosomonas cryotolerans]SFP98795.1 Uncharacterized conserved protein [Nitrosomonas cryotolerans]SIN90981.1 Uncharacterized conserved protein [Nitrosomonas cryotolerans ATCC 49181]
MKTQICTLLIRSILAISFFSVATYAAATTTVEVYKSPTCGCCSKWVDHLRDNGFTVKTNDVGNKEARARAGFSNSVGSCHTAFVNGYAIEGHVPAQDIKRLLKERPKAVGLAVPDMPKGSPGMEGPRSEPYNVLLVEKKGDQRIDATVYSRHDPSAQKPDQAESGGSIMRLK